VAAGAAAGAVPGAAEAVAPGAAEAVAPGAVAAFIPSIPRRPPFFLFFEALAEALFMSTLANYFTQASWYKI